MPGQLLVGAAKREINPQPGAQLAGWLDTGRPAEVFLDPLEARAMVIDNVRTAVALVGLDVLSLRWTQVKEIRRLVAEKTPIPPGNVLVACSHTHCGPVTASIGGEKRDEEFLRELAAKVSDAVMEAYSRRRPARIGIASGFEGRISFNRRYITKAGGTRTHPAPASPDVRCVEGPMDPEVGVLCARDISGKTIGNVVNFACHPTHHGGGKTVTADYPGALDGLRREIDGPQSVTVFLNGAFGNLHHMSPIDPAYNDGDTAERMAKVLCADMDQIIARMRFEEELPLAVKARMLDFPLKKIPKEIIDRAREVLVGPVTLSDEPVHVDRIFDKFSGGGKFYAQMVLDLYERRKRRPYSCGEIQAMRVGDAAFVGIPAEVFCEIGLKIKLESPARFTYIVGNANGTKGYMPWRTAFELPMKPGSGPCYGTKGDYETRPVPWCGLAPEAADTAVETAGELIGECFKKK